MRRTLTTWLLGGLLALRHRLGAGRAPGRRGGTRTQATTTRPPPTSTERHRASHAPWRGRRQDVDDRRSTAGSGKRIPPPRRTRGPPASSTCRRPTRCRRDKFSFSLFRDNLDRDPKDEDISIHGVSLGYGLTQPLRALRQLRPAEPHRRRRAVPARLRERLPVRLHAVGDRARRPQARRQVRLPRTTTRATRVGLGRPRLRQDPHRRRGPRPRHRQDVVGRRPRSSPRASARRPTSTGRSATR